MNYKNDEISTINQYLQNRKGEFNKEIGNIIKENKEYRKLTNIALADRAQISPLYLSEIEKGNYNMSLLKFVTICNSLEMYPNELLEPFLIGCKKDEDRFYQIFGQSKNININIIEYIKSNIKCDYKLFN